jgi:hypothetical protein
MPLVHLNRADLGGVGDSLRDCSRLPGLLHARSRTSTVCEEGDEAVADVGACELCF